MKLATTTTIATLALSAAGALAQCSPPSLRPPVGGGCPQGWQASGRYCTPSERAQDVIVKPPNGVCPFGWTASASYCLRSGDSRRVWKELASLENNFCGGVHKNERSRYK